MRDRSEKINIYDLDNNFLKSFNSTNELVEWSKTVENNLPIKSRFNGEYIRGVDYKELKYSNIRKACKEGIPYKGLIFKFDNK